MPTYQSRVAGIYRATYIGCQEKKLIDQETGEEQDRYLWRFQEVSDPLTTGEIAKFTTTNMQSPNSNAHKMAAGIVGRKLQPGDDTEQYIGQVYDVVYGPNQAGNLTITSVVKVVAETVNPVLPTEAEKAQETATAAPPAELP